MGGRAPTLEEDALAPLDGEAFTPSDAAGAGAPPAGAAACSCPARAAERSVGSLASPRATLETDVGTGSCSFPPVFFLPSGDVEALGGLDGLAEPFRSSAAAAEAERGVVFVALRGVRFGDGDDPSADGLQIDLTYADNIVR